MKKIIALACLCYFLQASGQGQRGFQGIFTTENDFLGIDNKDENYTGSAKIEFLLPQQKWLNWMPFYRFSSANTTNITSLAIGATAYTPQNLASAEIVADDRPYASLMFVSIGNTSYQNVAGSGMTLQSELIIGTMGAEGPGSAQAYIHDNHWFGSERPIPLGWDNQIGEGGSLVVNYNSRLQLPLFDTGKDAGFSPVQGSSVFKLDLGNYMINAQAGLRLNLLNINSNRFLDYNFTLPTVAVAPAAPAPAPANKKFRFSLFVEPHIRFAAYNATLEGQMFSNNDAYTIDHSDVKRFLFEITAGANFLFCDSVYLKYTFFGRSREFEGGKSFHTWGGITVGFSPQKWFG